MQSLQQRIAATEARFFHRHPAPGDLALAESGALPAPREDPNRVIRRLVELGRAESATRILSIEGTEGLGPIAMGDLDTLERIIGGNDLIGVEFLFLGAQTARSVGRVVVRSQFGSTLGFGTGFLISSNLMMTNNHVLTSVNNSSQSTLQFDFYQPRVGPVKTPVEFRLRPDIFFATDQPLDFTVVAIEQVNSQGARLAERLPIQIPKASVGVVVGERVNIIQHPQGRPQELSLRDNRVSDVLDDFFHYSSDTEQGSSGSPVFNDQWQLAALHHSGVPKRNAQGQILLQNGEPWDGSSATIKDIAWVANEGVRINRIVEHLEGLSGLSSAQQDLLDALLELFASGGVPAATRPVESGVQPRTGPRIDAQGRAHWVIPIEVTIGVGEPGTVTVSPPPGPDPKPDDSPPPDDGTDEVRPYYDQGDDEASLAAYYRDLPDSHNGPELFQALSALVSSTHATPVAYRTARLEHLYPWIDLHPEPRVLRSVYSGVALDAQEIIQADLEIERAHQGRLEEFLLREGAVTPDQQEEFLAALEAQMPFNCEHVVPQSWFNRREPMRGDMHHLYTCESGCNSFRSNIPYFQFGPEDEVVRGECGRRETDKFEPESGKGAVARSTLYFLLRYPGQIGDENRELQRERLTVLLNWHREFEVSLWERHRNAEIARVQGNRNPLIDHPEWADQIDFGPGFG